MRDNTDILEQFRRKDRNRTGYHFISDERFNSLTIGIRKQGAVVLRGGEEVERHLDMFDAGASSVGDILYFREQVTITEVLEEIRHFEQNKQGLNNEKNHIIRTLLNEIDAKESIIRDAKKYQIPREEIEETKQQLKELHKVLKKEVSICVK